MPMLAALQDAASDAMPWFLPLLIFTARIGDVSIGTVRSMLVVAGYQVFPAVLGFFEVMIWVLAVSGTLQYVMHPLALIGYAGGYATGVMIGVRVEEWLAIGFRMVRIVSINKSVRLCNMLREAGYRVTQVEGSGRTGPVEIAFLVIRRRQLSDVRSRVATLAPEAFLTVERVEQQPVGGGFSRARAMASEDPSLIDRALSLKR